MINKSLQFKKQASLSAGLLCLSMLAQPLAAQDAQGPVAPTYADLATLADSSQLVIRAEIRSQALVEPERAHGLAPGYARLYIKARTIALLSGTVPVGEELTYLADVPFNAKGKVPKLKRLEVLLFAQPVAGRLGAVQLIAPSAQLQYTPDIEARLRPILQELAAADAPPRINGVRDALSVRGNLAGESETQIFLDTSGGQTASLSVLRRPGLRPVWGIAWGEIIDQAARAPEPETLAWYRLACSLPEQLPRGAILSSEAQDMRLAASDYALVRESLGPCERRLPTF